jgi:uncharacterized protein (DUF433 family)
MFHSNLYARHRLIDAIHGRHEGGDSIELLAEDYGLPKAAIRAAIESNPEDNEIKRKT